MSRLRYFGVRTVQTIFLLWFMLTFLFLLFRFLPGSYADVLLYRTASPEAAQVVINKWGLNDPLHVQYIRFLENYLTLNAGTSFQYSEPVVEVVSPLMFNTFILVAPAITLAFVVGSIIGAIAGVNRDSTFDRYGVIPFVVFGTIPMFFLSILAIIVFSMWLDIFPVGGMLSARIQPEGFSKYLSTDFLWHYVLPFSVVFTRYLFTPILIMRTNVVEVIGSPFFKFHRISGVPKVRRLRNVIRHASLPVITIYPISMTRAIGGLILVETVFNWPGIGNALVIAVFSRDFPIVQYVFFLIAAFVIISNFIVDILYGIIDPRVSVGDD